jgi:hypothetical protein
MCLSSVSALSILLKDFGGWVLEVGLLTINNIKTYQSLNKASENQILK